jgi:hypothetical protein
MGLPPKHIRVSVSSGISFAKEIDGQSVHCRVEREALVGREGLRVTTNSELRSLFEKYERFVDQAVAQKITDNDLESDGSICIRHRDLLRQR